MDVIVVRVGLQQLSPYMATPPNAAHHAPLFLSLHLLNLQRIGLFAFQS